MSSQWRVAVCVYAPEHHGMEDAHGLKVCAECERPMVAIDLPGAPAILASGEVVPVAG
jgi:hypothetical protein